MTPDDQKKTCGSYVKSAADEAARQIADIAKQEDSAGKRIMLIVLAATLAAVGGVIAWKLDCGNLQSVPQPPPVQQESQQAPPPPAN